MSATDWFLLLYASLSSAVAIWSCGAVKRVSGENARLRVCAQEVVQAGEALRDEHERVIAEALRNAFRVGWMAREEFGKCEERERLN